MIITFFGKGGVGKSTLSSRFARFLSEKGVNTLAIDADYNMDMAYNLGVDESTVPKIGVSHKRIKEYIGVSEQTKFMDIVMNRDLPCFYISTPDQFTRQHSVEINQRLRLMICGNMTDDILLGTSCGHSVGAPLKAYLPLLKLDNNDAVVIDEKAGTDGVATGIVSGSDLAVIITDESPQGLKAARQIEKMVYFFGVPSILILNKKNSAILERDIDPYISIKSDVNYMNPLSPTSKEDLISFEKIFDRLRKCSLSNNRLKKSKEKFEKSQAYKT